MLNILKIMGEVKGDPHESRQLDLQTVEASDCPSCKTNKTPQIRTDKVDANYANANIPDYSRSSINSAAHKRARQLITQKLHNEIQ